MLSPLPETIDLNKLEKGSFVEFDLGGLELLSNWVLVR